jgi:hypothetical protein
MGILFFGSYLNCFTFNPYRGYLAPLVTAFGASGAHLPQVPPVAIHIQPLWGWRVDKLSTKSVIIRKNQTHKLY